MTAVLDTPQPTAPPSDKDAAEGPGERLRWALADCWTIVRREMTHLVRQPSLVAWQLGFPIISVLLFVYVFGSAMDVGGGADYKDFAMPGMFTMTMAFGFMNTAMSVAIDKDRGVIDRFRSMPMSPSAVVTGRGVSDVVHAALDLVVLVGIALVIGWRPDGLLPALGALSLLLLLRFALIWVGVWIGLKVRNQEVAGNLFAIAFPFGMISSVFTPPSMMPDWLGAVAMWNPVSSTANAVRDLFGQPMPTTGGSWIEAQALPMAIAWPLLLTLVFLPLAVRRFQSLSR